MNKWRSTENPVYFSKTVKGIALLLVPIVRELFGIEVGSERVGDFVDAAFIIVSGLVAIAGYFRAKRVLGARIEQLGTQVRALGGKIDSE